MFKRVTDENNMAEQQDKNKISQRFMSCTPEIIGKAKLLSEMCRKDNDGSNEQQNCTDQLRPVLFTYGKICYSLGCEDKEYMGDRQKQDYSAVYPVKSGDDSSAEMFFQILTTHCTDDLHKKHHQGRHSGELTSSQHGFIDPDFIPQGHSFKIERDR